MKSLKTHSLLLEFIYVDPSDIIDKEGRPIRETKSSEKIKDKVNFEMKKCPYKDSRFLHQKKMNVTPLKVMTRIWDDIITEIIIIKYIYVKKHKIKKVHLDDLWLISAAGIFYPYFLVLKKKKSTKNGEIPIIISSLFKICLGINMLGLEMLMKVSKESSKVKDYEINSDMIYEYANIENQLIGPDEVCAGPINLIKQILDVMTNNSSINKNFASNNILKEEESCDFFFFYTQASAVILMDVVYKKIELDLYSRIIRILEELVIVDPSRSSFQELYDKLKSSRDKPTTYGKTQDEGTTYSNIKKIIKKISFNDTFTINTFQKIVSKSTNRKSNEKRVILNYLIKSCGCDIDDQHIAFNLYNDFINLAFSYIEKERLFINMLFYYENRLIKTLGFENADGCKNIDKKSFLDYNKFYFTDMFFKAFENK